MTTTADFSKHLVVPMMAANHNRWSKSKQSYYIRRKNFRNHEHFRFSGNRKDPLNLNELIQKKKQLATIDTNIYGNDRPIEILLQPNIFDPLGLDISSYTNENCISFYSTNQQTYVQKPQRYFQPIAYNWCYDQYVPEQR